VATDLLARIRGELDERIRALRPLLSEYARLIAAAETLATVAAEPLPTPLERPPAEEAPTAAEPAHEPFAPEPTSAASAVREHPLKEPLTEAPTMEPPVREPPAEIAPSTPSRPRGRPPRGSAAGTFGLAMSLRTTPPIHPIARTPVARPGEPPAPKRGATEALEWLTPMPGAPAEAERPDFAREAERDEQETSASHAEDTARRREPVSPAAAQQAILAALEHGSHTPGELVMVTAMSPTEIRSNLGRLARRGAVAKVKRHGDGKAAYALPSLSVRV
jgi:hypothetical protein